MEIVVLVATLAASLAATIYLFAIYFSDEPDERGRRSWFLWTLATLALMKLLIGGYFAVIYAIRNLSYNGDVPDWTRPITGAAIVILLLSSVFYALQIERRRRAARRRRLSLKEALVHDADARPDPESG